MTHDRWRRYGESKARWDAAVAAAQRAHDDGTFQPAMLAQVEAAMAECNRAFVRCVEAELGRDVARAVAEGLEMVSRAYVEGRFEEARALARAVQGALGAGTSRVEARLERRAAALH